MKTSLRSDIQRGLNRYILFVYVLTIILIFMSKLISPSFGSLDQVKAILVLSSLIVLIGYGQGVVIMTGELDLSIGVVITMAGVLTSMWLGNGNGNIGTYFVIILILLLVGFINGFGIAYLKIPSFIMTLAMQMVISGFILGYTNGTPGGQAPAVLEKMMTSIWFGLPSPIFILIIITVVGFLIQRYTRFGRNLYAVGSNRVAAYYSGILVKRTIISAYMTSALCAGLTGMLLVGYSGGSSLTMGDSYLLPSIATVVLGGAALSGGSGNYLGTVGAAIFLTTVSTIIQALGISIGWQNVIYGLMIFGVLTLYRKDLYENVQRKLGRWLQEEDLSKSSISKKS